MVLTLCVLLVFLIFMLSLLFSFFFFFKQKTAYEMRISDWSSDVCSSDLLGDEVDRARIVGLALIGHDARVVLELVANILDHLARRTAHRGHAHRTEQIWQERAEQQRSEEHTSELQSLNRISYAGFCLKKKNKLKNQKTTPITSTHL